MTRAICLNVPPISVKTRDNILRNRGTRCFVCLRQSKSWRRIIISSCASSGFRLWFSEEKQGLGPLKRKRQTDSGREYYANIHDDDDDCLDGDNDDWICEELETVLNGRGGGGLTKKDRRCLG